MLNKRTKYKYLFLLFNSAIIISAVMFTGCTTNVSDKPNIVIIYADDLNFSQLGCYGGNFLTPNIDNLARGGARFDHYYASSPVCTASRYNLLTGRFAARSLDLERQFPAGDAALIRWNTFLIKGEKTVAHMLKDAGYVTGMVGKYHLYDNESGQKQLPPDADPGDPEVKRIISENYQAARNEICATAGFDYAESIYANNLHALGLPLSMQIHNMEWITSGALNFIVQNKDKPFFLYMATTIPHGPSPVASMKSDPRITPAGILREPPAVQSLRPAVFERVKNAGLPENAAPITWLDDAIGTVYKKLTDLDLLENTVIILAGDHGGEKGKMTCYEGGAHAPAIAYWKNHIMAGTVIDEITANIDIAPTILELVNIQKPAAVKIDGLSLWPLLQGQKTGLREAQYLEVTYTRGVVTDEWKYIAVRFPKDVAEKIASENGLKFNQEGQPVITDVVAGEVRARYGVARDYPGYYDSDQLYHLKSDPDEQNNLAFNPQYLSKVNELNLKLKEFSRDLPHAFGEFKE